MRAALIGCGQMGGAMAHAWLEDFVVSHLQIIDPAPCSIDDTRVTHSTELTAVDADVLILAVKPQVLGDAVAGLDLSADTLVLSIAAGQNLKTLESLFGAQQPIVRSMPNTPAAIGIGMSVSIANKYVYRDAREMTGTLMHACGQHQWIEDESLMDAVTALSGSGPAYVFYMIEALSRAGVEIGLSETLSAVLARQVVIGSAGLADIDSCSSPAKLRENVTSPNGTTAAGLSVLMDGRFDDVMRETLEAAKTRSEALNG